MGNLGFWNKNWRPLPESLKLKPWESAAENAASVIIVHVCKVYHKVPTFADNKPDPKKKKKIMHFSLHGFLNLGNPENLWVLL